MLNIGKYMLGSKVYGINLFTTAHISDFIKIITERTLHYGEDISVSWPIRLEFDGLDQGNALNV